MRRRVTVTGIGVVAPGGIGVKPFWDLISSGRTATRGVTLFDSTGFRSRVAAEIDFDPAANGLSTRDSRRLDRFAQLAVVAAREAVEDADLAGPGLDPTRTGVSIGSAVGATMSLEEQYRVVSDDGREHLVDHRFAPFNLYEHLVPSSVAAEIAHVAAAEGPATVISTGCTSGIDAVGYGAELIRDGTVDVMVVGATDAPIAPITAACFDAIKATTPRNDEPATASRPFDRSRNGFVLGEGAAVLVLEEADRARRRGARGYGEVAGFATRCNAFHMTGLRPDGREMAEAIRRALHDARTAPGSVDYVNAHGSGTRQNDRHETAAFKAALGEHAYRVPVSSIKSMIGHSLGAIGALEIVASLLAITTNVVPPTANLHEADPECDLDYVPVSARDRHTATVLTVGSGFGGFQSAMVLRRATAGEW